MGVLEFFGIDIEKKENKIIDSLKSNLKESFKRIKEDISEQKEWISHIHSDFKYHKNEIKSHIGTHSDNFENVSQWIEYLNNSNNNLKKEVISLEKSIYSRIKKDFSTFNNQILSAIRSQNNTHNMEIMAKKVELLERKIIALESEKKAYIPEIKINHKNTYQENSSLNNTQQKILSLLYSSSIPIDYSTIAKNLNISIISARVYVKKLKDMGYGIETAYSGKKVLITINNKQKIKKFYNN
ncbi:winged helix-turn-helix transcriptional regulator [archaeon]|jgi:hypothetical protein|nr:winged helix-turn-helix transcriptional regulator [archaeon]MBT4648433.1 winged helix-turn-helix transcriptional regulator [archaeon]MBT6821759.1 winged helix-turn-helix transcriptional regulator [archaeon]MBT7391211.1 winged helix-turn-helix transcriptional regulator [archaeon]